LRIQEIAEEAYQFTSPLQVLEVTAIGSQDPYPGWVDVPGWYGEFGDQVEWIGASDAKSELTFWFDFYDHCVAR
jgi:hypothetical protein